MGSSNDSGGSGGSPPSSGDGSNLPRAGDRVAGKYVIEKVLGVGGMGIVLSARHAHLGQRVAIKLMLGASSRDPMAVERFLREARAAVALASDHVAKVSDVGTLDDGSPYMVMEYLAGRDLGAIVEASGPMAVMAAVDAVLQACDAIAEAHSLGIVHRDLKPSNLFMTTRRDGRPLVKVLDFGISKAATTDPVGGQALTSTGMVMGSPSYMSPEQIRSAKDTDARSDVWALGVILYELLSGKPPFQGDTIGETFARIFSDEPAPLRATRSDVPPALESAIMQCLRRDPGQRVQSVASLARLIAPFASPDVAAIVARLPPSSGDSMRGTQRAPTTYDPRSGAIPVSVREATAPAWQQPSAVPAPHRTRTLWTAAAAATGLLVAGGLGMVFLHGAKDAPAAASAVAPAASAPPVAAMLTPQKAVEARSDSRSGEDAATSNAAERPSDGGRTGAASTAEARAPIASPAHRPGAPAKAIDAATSKAARGAPTKASPPESAPAPAPAKTSTHPSGAPDFGY